MAHVCPVFKKGDNTLCSNYHPISLLSNVSKLLKKIVHDKIYKYLTDNVLLIPNNSGSNNGDSTMNQLLCLSVIILTSLDKGKEARIVFLDAAKGFDKGHKGLLYQLKQLGIEGDILTCLSSYLPDRQQRVVIGGSQSLMLPVRTVVPQRSVLGPLLFLVYVNDIAHHICTNLSLFVNDTSLYEIAEDTVLSAERLNRDLARLYGYLFK